MNILSLRDGLDDYVIEQPFDFAKHSTIACGGIAPIAFYPRSEVELSIILSRLKAHGIAYYVLGNLSNVLPPEDGAEKAVICTGRITEITPTASGVFVGAGVMGGMLMRALRQMGLSGAEFLCGIPCTLGGALYMNAGAGGRYLSEIVDSVRIYREGLVLELPVNACEYAYKSSVFMRNGDIILGGTFRLKRTDSQTVLNEQKAWKAKRAHLPIGKSMGCIFKNPPSGSAGIWIEKSGFKGLRVGGAKVSEEHANFIINDKAASVADIKTLIQMVKNGVFAQYGVLLEEEIVQL